MDKKIKQAHADSKSVLCFRLAVSTKLARNVKVFLRFLKIKFKIIEVSIKRITKQSVATK